MTKEPEHSIEEQQQRPVDVLGDFAIASFQTLGTGKLTNRQIVKAATCLLGRHSRHALVEGVQPPEAAVLDLCEDAEDAAREVLAAGLKASPGLKEGRQIHPHTASRMQRFVNYGLNPEPQPTES